jgi:predicted RNA-binding protein
MCQITVYLDDEKIMENVLLVEPTPEGVRLVAMFEQPREIKAAIQKIDLIKNILILGNTGKEEIKNGRER